MGAVGCEARAGGGCLHHVVIESWSSAEECEGRGGGQLSGGMHRETPE